MKILHSISNINLLAKLVTAIVFLILNLQFLLAQQTTYEVIEEIYDLEDSTVIGKSYKTPWLDNTGSITSILNDQFINSGGLDMGDIIRYDATVSAPFNFGSPDNSFGYGQTGYTGFNIRGIEGNRINMLLDGIRQPEQYISTSFAQDDGSSGGAGRDYYDPAIFFNTEIFKGSASSLYGSDALAGVVAFRTPVPDDFLEGDDDNFGGLLRTQQFTQNSSVATQGFFAFRKNQFSIMLGLAYRDGKESENNGDIKPNPIEFDNLNLISKVHYNANGSNNFNLTLETFNRDRFINALSANQFTNIFDKSIINQENQTRKRYSLNWEHDPITYTNKYYDSINTKIYYQSSNNSSINKSESTTGRTRNQVIEFDTTILGIDSRFLKTTEKHKLAFGLEASISSSENRFFREDNGLPPFPNRISFAPSDTNRAAVYIQSDYKHTETSPWSFLVGLRADYYSVKPELSTDYLERINRLSEGLQAFAPAENLNNLTLAPRLDVKHDLTKNSRIYVTYSRGVRNPTAEEISMIFDHPPVGGNPAGTLTLPNPDLKEESSNAYEIGFKYLNEDIKFQASSFYTSYSNFIESGVSTGQLSSTGQDILTTVNRGSAEIYGFELSGDMNLSLLNNMLKSLDFGLSTGKTWGVNKEDNTWINSIEPWKSVAWIQYASENQKFSTRLTATYVDDVKRINDSDGGPFFRPPSYFTLDLSAKYQINESLSLQAGVNNILDKKYWRWANTRRSGGHLQNLNAVDDRSTAPGTNGFISLEYRF